jgi:O-antigen biosynthesis protein
MRAILTNLHLRNFGGSELVTVEIAEFLMQSGWDVTIYSPEVGPPLDTSHLNVVTSMPTLKGWDLAWIHHNLLIKAIKDDRTYIVSNHMSSYVQVEMPSFPSHMARKIFANSEETRSKLEPCYMGKSHLFQNPAPSQFEKCHENGAFFLFVTNHPPAEVFLAAKALGSKTRIVGGSMGSRVSREAFKGVRAVICNGKTVQYALRANCPVYLYDHFQGPGWLTEDNFKKAEWFNFSGRCSPNKKTHKQIIEELHNMPHNVVLNCPDRFKLELRMGEILSEIQGYR